MIGLGVIVAAAIALHIQALISLLGVLTTGFLAQVSFAGHHQPCYFTHSNDGDTWQWHKP